MTGKRFGRLLVVELYSRGTRRKPVLWLCQCNCGNQKIISSPSLRTGRSNSCGCLNKEINRALRTKHGKRHTAAYNSWASMISRCTNKNNKNYEDYGGRGIAVCHRWLEFENFIYDMGEKPPGTEIDRIDNNGNYEPSNCRWTTHKVNSRNTRKCRYIEHDGERLTISEWAERAGLTADALRYRINSGHSLGRILIKGNARRSAS